ncbi:MAG: hypothetical protein PVS3B2_00200 [Candidatus Dormibacteraceae bacterium]
MGTPLRHVRSPLQRDVERVLADCAQADPDEVLIVYVKGGNVCTLSTGTFSKMRTLGALELLKDDILHG